MGCVEEEEIKTCNLDITLYESYDLTELFPLIIDANHLIRKEQLDSIASVSSGLTLLDKINEEKAKSDTIIWSSMDDSPLFNVLSLNTVLKDKENYPDTSAIIGFILDSLKLKKYLAQTCSIFPDDLEWVISGKLFDNGKSLHAIKRGKPVITILNNDIDSIIVTPLGLNSFYSELEKKSYLKEYSSYWVELKLTDELKEKLGNKIFSMIFNTGNHEYSGSIVDFESEPNQYILVGEMDYDDFLCLKNKFETRLKIIK